MKDLYPLPLTDEILNIMVGHETLVEVKFEFMWNISHYCNNIFAFHMPMFIIFVFSLQQI
jgi:hypothetical protein